jgi:hypothetical protein
MLTAHGVLPERDEELARIERWVTDLLETIVRGQVGWRWWGLIWSGSVSSTQGE